MLTDLDAWNDKGAGATLSSSISRPGVRRFRRFMAVVDWRCQPFLLYADTLLMCFVGALFSRWIRKPIAAALSLAIFSVQISRAPVLDWLGPSLG